MRRLLSLIALMSWLLTACSNDNEEQMIHIKRVGDSNPGLALSMLDSISTKGMNEKTQMIYDMLHVRLCDKAYIVAKSDERIKAVVDYFTKHGTTREKQEAYYYAASVYRDMKDTPRALEFYLKSRDVTQEGEYDILMLRNTYSQLNRLYYSVQHYRESLRAAESEEQTNNALGIDDIVSKVHIICSLMKIGHDERAMLMQDSILGIIEEDPKKIDSGTLCQILTNYCFWHNQEKAKACYKIIADRHDTLSWFAKARYYRCQEMNDSAIWNFKMCIENTTDPLTAYDAYRCLIRLLDQDKDSKLLGSLSKQFVELCDTLDMGMRQEMAATTNNQYTYYRNKEEERKIREENLWIRSLISMITSFAVMLILAIVTFNYVQRNRQLKKLLHITTERNNLQQQKEALEADIMSKTAEMECSKAQLQQIDIENEDLKKQLSLRIKQNTHLLGLATQSRINENAEHVIDRVKKAAEGKQKLSNKEWKQLLAAVNQLYPELKKHISSLKCELKEEQLRVYYLFYIGLSNPQIEHITNTPKTTVWRWRERFSEVFLSPQD